MFKYDKYNLNIMASVVAYALGSVFLVSLISLIGVFGCLYHEKSIRKILLYLVSFAAGALLGDVFIHLLPGMVETVGFTLQISLYIMGGIVFSFIVEKFIHWRHCHFPDEKGHVHTFAWMTIFGDAVHNFIDGILITAAYFVSIPVGIATTTAVIFHEIPQEIADFGVLIHGGFSKTEAILINFATALTAILGAFLTLVLYTTMENASAFLIPFTAGTFIYIASADLIPELHKEVKIERSVMQLGAFILGIGFMVVLLRLEGIF
jgi:zinc and cadmium transporter